MVKIELTTVAMELLEKVLLNTKRFRITWGKYMKMQFPRPHHRYYFEGPGLSLRIFIFFRHTKGLGHILRKLTLESLIHTIV